MPTIVFLLVLLLCSSCKRDRQHTLAEGQVFDPTTQQVVPHARVYLLQTHGTSLYASPSRVQHTTADEWGRYNLSFEADGNDRYDLQASAPGYFDTPGSEYVGLVTGDKNKKNVPLRPEARLKIRFLSTAPPNNSGVLLGSPSIQGLYGISSPADSVVWVKCEGNQQRRIIAQLSYVSLASKTLDTSIFCPAHDTTNFTIRF